MAGAALTPAGSHSFPGAVEHARISGSEPLRRPYLATPVLEIAQPRVVWLLVLAIGVALTPEASSTSMQLPHNLEGLLEEVRAVATSLLALASCLSATSVTQTG